MIGHSPKSLKRIFLWLLHEAQMPRSELCMHLKKNDINANKVLLSAWSNHGNRPRWSVWKQIYAVLSDILGQFGLKVEDFVYEDTYTPTSLRKLREKSQLSLDEFAEKAGEKPQRILLYESNSKENGRGIGYANFHEIKKKVLNLDEIVETSEDYLYCSMNLSAV